MITITCAYLISTIMIFGISLFDTGTRSAWKRNGAFFALMVVTVAIMVYFVLPSRNMLSIMLANGVLGLVYYLLVQGKQLWQQGSHAKKKVHRKLLPNWVGWVVAVLVIIALGGELYSYLTVKPTWNSIAKTTSKAKEAPTFKRNETPIAIAPKTVLNRVRKAASDIPHSQYYRISDNVQAQYYQGKPVYVVAVNTQGSGP